MVDYVSLLLEKTRVKNILRKMDLQKRGVGSNKEYADKHIREWEKNKPKSVLDTFNLLKIRDPKKADEYMVSAREAEYGKYLRTSIKKDRYEKIYEKYGVKFYIDMSDSMWSTPQGEQLKTRMLRNIKLSVDMFLNDIKGILPLKKPTFIIKNLNKDSKLRNVYKTGEKDIPPAYYLDRIIYLDFSYIDNHAYMTHEYAHYIADLIPKQTEPILQAEYSKMLDNYFKDGKKRKSLGGIHNKNIRAEVAKKMGLPTDYAATNFDEWFAEIITHWKSIPNNVATYRFKNALKKVIIRL